MREILYCLIVGLSVIFFGESGTPSTYPTSTESSPGQCCSNQGGNLGTGASWAGLSFDSKNFMCSNWDTFFSNILEEIGCSSNTTEQIKVGCSEETNQVQDWVGHCTCLSPLYFTAGTRVTQQLINSRLLPEMSWILEPWNTGPPYDIPRTYIDMCQLLMDRINCPLSYQNIAASSTPTYVNGQPVESYTCTCGNLTLATTQVNNLIIDKINDYQIRTTPVFSDPVYLSVSMSICMTLICGKIGAIIAVYFGLPPIVGFLLAGLGIQNILNPMYLKGAGYPFPSPASELKLIALIIVLMRAGLAIKFEEIMANGLMTTLLSFIPYFCEFFTFMYYGQTIYGYTPIDMGLFASIMAPLGPSVVISGLLMMVANKKTDTGYVPKQLLITTPLEAVIAIVLFGIFSSLEQTVVPPLYPWVKVLPLYENCLLIPANLLFSSVMGVGIGYFCSLYIDWRSKTRDDFVWVRVDKNPQMGSSTADLVFIMVVACYTMMSLCTVQYIQQSSGVLVVFVASITVSILANPKITLEIAQGLKGIWIFAEIFLFTLTGVSLALDSNNGPLYGNRGLSGAAIKDLLGVMFLSSAARFVGLGLATVQATLGSTAYYQHVIPGAVGLNIGLVIAQSTAFTVLIFAPIGTILTKFVGKPISVYLTKLDNEAMWSVDKSHYHAASPYAVGKWSRKDAISASPSTSSVDNLAEEPEYLNSIGEVMHEPETIIELVPRMRAMSIDLSHTLQRGYSVSSVHDNNNNTSRKRSTSLSQYALTTLGFLPHVEEEDEQPQSDVPSPEVESIKKDDDDDDVEHDLQYVNLEIDDENAHQELKKN